MMCCITIFPHVRVCNVGESGVDFLELTSKNIYELLLNYQKSSNSFQQEQKHFTLAKFKDLHGARVAENIEYFSGLVIDFDFYIKNYDELQAEINRTLKNYEYLYYTTASHSYIAPRVRLLIFADSPIKLEEKQVILDRLLENFSEELFVAIDQQNTFSRNSLSRMPFQSNDFDMRFFEGEPLKINSNQEPKIEHYDQIDEQTLIKKTFNNTPVCDLTESDIVNYLIKFKDIVGFDRDTGWFDSYEDWLEVGSILHHQFRGGEVGLKLWQEISNETSDTLKYTYSKFSLEKEEPKTFRSIIKVVNDSLKKTAILHENLLAKKMPLSKFRDLHMNEKFKTERPVKTYGNFKCLVDFYGLKIDFDILAKKVFINGRAMDADMFMLIDDLMKINRIEQRSESAIERFITTCAQESSYNSFYRELRSVSWDGVDRLNDFYSTLKVKEEYVEIRNKYLLCWLKQLIYLSCFKTINPIARKKIGRLLLVLVSKQSCGKTSWIESLMPRYLVDKYISLGRTLKTDDHKELKNILSKLIVELAELEESLKKTNTAMFKSFFGRTTDPVKIIFKQELEECDRTTSFIATTNNFNFLKDPTGSTRFMVLPLGTDFKNTEGRPILCNANHGIDMLMLYRQVLESEDWDNFELDIQALKMQEEINREFSEISSIEELFLQNFSTEIDNTAPAYSCTQVLLMLGYQKHQCTKLLTNDMANILREFKFPYLKCEKKFKIKAKLRNEDYADENKIQEEVNKEFR